MTFEAPWLSVSFPELSNVSKLGEGGQKVVFSATHATDGEVVLKLIRAGQNPARIEREIQAVQTVISHRVPKVLDAGVADTQAGSFIWLREQRVVGECLRDELEHRTLRLDEALRLGLHVLEALADAERYRIVHRDVKPENIMVDGNGDFWLLDFGIARHLDLESLTATALGGVGTVGYAPPEQYQNRKREIDARADLFALGVTLYEVLAGHHPFRAGARDVREVLRRIEQSSLPPLVVEGDRSGEFAGFVATLAQRRREHRPMSAADALDWLRKVASSIS